MIDYPPLVASTPYSHILVYVAVFGLAWRFMRGISETDYGAPKWVETALGKYPFALYATISHWFAIEQAFMTTEQLYSSLQLLTALALAVAFGWGRGFLAIHGNQREGIDDYNDKSGWKWYKDIPALFCFKLIKGHEPYSERPRDMRFYGFLWMTFDGIYRLAPLVAVCSFSNPLALLALPPSAVAFGASYRIAGLFWHPKSDKVAVNVAEILSGLVIGGLVVCV